MRRYLLFQPRILIKYSLHCHWRTETHIFQTAPRTTSSNVMDAAVLHGMFTGRCDGAEGAQMFDTF